MPPDHALDHKRFENKEFEKTCAGRFCNRRPGSASEAGFERRPPSGSEEDRAFRDYGRTLWEITNCHDRTTFANKVRTFSLV